MRVGISDDVPGLFEQALNHVHPVQHEGSNAENCQNESAHETPADRPPDAREEEEEECAECEAQDEWREEEPFHVGDGEGEAPEVLVAPQRIHEAVPSQQPPRVEAEGIEERKVRREGLGIGILGIGDGGTRLI